MKPLRHIATLAALVTGLVSVAGAAARAQQEPSQSGLGVRLTEAPVARRDDPRAQRFIVDHVAPGTEFSRSFEVLNQTGREITVQLYPAAANVTESGFSPAAGRTQNELSGWTTVEPEQMTLAPGEVREGTVTIAVPRDAEAGERYAVVLVELPPPPGASIAVGSRVGIRVYLSVGGGGEPPTDFELPSFIPVRGRDGRPGIDIRACNTGGRAVDLVGEVLLENGPGNIEAGPFVTDGATTFPPGTCAEVPLRFERELPLGPWDATAKLRSGTEERTAQARITFPEDAGERGEKVETREVTGTLPGIIATGVSSFLVLVLGGWLFWFLFKRRARRKDDEEEVNSAS